MSIHICVVILLVVASGSVIYILELKIEIQIDCKKKRNKIAKLLRLRSFFYQAVSSIKRLIKDMQRA